MDANPSLQTSTSAHRALVPSRDNSRLGGFDNLFSKELGDWFHRRRWIRQAILWVAIINVLMAFVLFAAPRIDQQSGGSSEDFSNPAVMGIQMLFAMMVVGGSIGTIIKSQDEIVGEKQSGTAAWILSKPVSRAAFVLSKLLANLLGMLVFIIAIPGAVGYGEIWAAAGRAPAVLPFLAGLGIAALGLIFYLTLTLMLGVLYDRRGPVLGISLALLLGGSILASLAPQIAAVLPISLQDFSAMVALGQPLPAMGIAEVAATAAWCVAFSAVAVWRFEKAEL